MNELLDLFSESGYKGRVEITSDSCYSGKLCHVAYEYFENNLKRKRLQIESFTVMASCYGGV